MNHAQNKALILKHEACRLRVYRDTAGHPTVGVGFNLDVRPWAEVVCRTVGVEYEALRAGQTELTQQQADQIFDMQYMRVVSQARITFPGIDETMPEEAVAVICDMIFNLGYGGFLGFQHMIAAFRAGRWAAAIQEMEGSAWAKQVPNRVKDDVALIEQIGADAPLKG